MIWHSKKLNRPPASEEWNNDPHIIDREALLEFLGISSGSGSGGGGGCTHWVLLDDLEFLSPVQSFTLDLDGYDFLRIEYAVVIVPHSSVLDPYFAIYPNGDTNRKNYSSFLHYTDSGNGHQRSSNWPSPYPLFGMGESVNVQTVNIGNILISLKNGIRRLFVNETSRIGVGYVLRGEHIALWTNTSSDVTSLNISSENCVLTGKVAVYGW